MFNVPNDVQLLNASTPIDNKFPPSATAGILAQIVNALNPIVWILPAIVRVLVMPEQLKNAPLSIKLTLSGMFNVPNDVQLLNALSPIDNKLPPSASARIFEQSLNA
jgi:hypothetical protein